MGRDDLYPKAIRRRRPRAWYAYPTRMVTIVVLFFAGGMSGGNCVLIPPDAGGAGPVIVEDDHILGSPDAKVTVVAYECFQ